MFYVAPGTPAPEGTSIVLKGADEQHCIHEFAVRSSLLNMFSDTYPSGHAYSTCNCPVHRPDPDGHSAGLDEAMVYVAFLAFLHLHTVHVAARGPD